MTLGGRDEIDIAFYRGSICFVFFVFVFVFALVFSVKAEIKLALRAIADLSALSRAVPHLGPECWPSDG